MMSRQISMIGGLGLLLPVLLQAQTNVPSPPDPAAPASSRLEQARYLYEQGIIFESIKQLELYLARQPDDVEARFMMGRLLEEVGHAERAAFTLTHVLQLDPQHRDAEMLLVRIRNYLGRQLDRTDQEAVLRYARLCARPGSYDRAAAHYALALELADTTSVRLEFAQMLYWAGAYEEAAYHYTIVLGRKPGALSVQREAGRVFMALGDFARAVTVLENYLGREPEHVPVELDLIRSLIWSGRVAEAKTRLEALLERDPLGVEVLLVQGTLAEAQGDLLQAYAFLVAVLEREPQHTEALARLQALQQGNRLQIARLQQQARQAPDDVDARMKLSALYEQNDQHGAAIEELEQLNLQVPANEEVFRRLRALREKELQSVRARVAAFRASRKEQYQQEREVLDAWLQRHPADRKTRLHLARLLVVSGQYAAAETALLQLLSAVPMNPLVVELLQLVRARRDRQDQPEPNQQEQVPHDS